MFRARVTNELNATLILKNTNIYLVKIQLPFTRKVASSTCYDKRFSTISSGL